MRVRRFGLQYRSSASQTGRQYCAVDSITTSSTSRSTSQSASARNWTGLVPTFSRSKWKSPSTSTSATATANIFLCTSIPAMWYGIGLSSWERRACLVASIRVASYRRAEHGDAQLFGQSRTLRVKQLLGLDCSMANLDLAAPSAAILPKLRFSCPFAGLQVCLPKKSKWAQDTPFRSLQRGCLHPENRRHRQ